MQCLQQFEKVKEAARGLSRICKDDITALLNQLADEAEKNIPALLLANQKDLERMDKEDPRYDRLMLSKERIEAIASDIRNVAKLPFPIGEVLEEKTLDNGMTLQKVRVPLGVIGVIYEARPNVTFDVFSLCLQSGNACVLKGGSDANYSNKAIVALIHQVLEKQGLNPELLQLLPPDRSAANELMNAVGYVDILIPRGSQGLINSVRDNANIPVIETGAGIVHTYVDASANIEKASHIVANAKTRRPSVCNSLDCLVLHKSQLKELPSIMRELKAFDVEVFADDASFASLKDNYPPKLLQKATPASYGTEFLSNKMSIKTVDNLDEALNHIYTFSSKHSEAIVAEDSEAIARFFNEVDAAAVYANASTAFTDGAQFGLGAEIGISTQKLHARGPMALKELTSYKWLIKGNGNIRPA
ncbi:glutamate-5-semialdehyde dehydrogenase [Saccharicrinis fermentans]|uniref:Gamma-glutamyl phosphate reductase n=1 Tax=Saccharicrinis fermentans DSM 9555 = JCM 21142 TaxID=869213 RepID=W7Y1Z7_9BACT|nr:glutamate-5-semialdehyde dehydrogenase [Saccharicrinis fermentans]GAF04900.1 gamma-glutamyl phosphate reductase [Saccharicrinis fermentans DSM 9555 = JCM 21142]